MNETIRERLFKQLDKCLSILESYNIASVMPLFYVVVAHHEGHLISIPSNNPNSLFSGKRYIQSVEIIDGIESDLLKSIRNSVSPNFFEGQSAEAIFNFYGLCNEQINDYYVEIIEHIISYYSARGAKNAGISITPKEVARLMSHLIKECNPTKIYDPCAGLCTYSLTQDLITIPFVGQEIDRLTKVIAEIRLYANRQNAAIYNEDSTLNWRESDSCDVLASELPFGISLNDISTDRNRPTLLEDYVLYKFINDSSLRKAVLMVSMGTCSKRGESFTMRKILCENNWVEYVIKLPAGILPSTGASSAILVLNKERTKKDIKFVLADDCISEFERKRILDYKGVIERVCGTDTKQTATIPFTETFKQDFSFNPGTYVLERIDVLPGQQIVKFNTLTTRVWGERQFNDTKGRILLPEHMFSNIIEMHTGDVYIEESNIKSQSLVKITGKGIIFNGHADKFYIKTDEEPLFISSSYACFAVQTNKCYPEYLAHCVINASQFKDSVSFGTSMHRIDWEHLLLPIYVRLDSQRQIVLRIYRQEQNELRKKLERLQVLSEKSSDLIHNLGITFTKICAGISDLMHDNESPTIIALNDNVRFALRQINSTGTNFKYVNPELCKVNLYEMVDKYIDAWQNFGYNTYDVFQSCNVSEDTKVEIDVDLFYTMLDCIFINAHQHGFNKHEDSENKMLVDFQGVIYNDEKYIRISFANNGNPLPDNFTIHDYVARGVVGLNSFQDGLGGNHIYEIVHKFNGLVSLESEKEWLTVSILLPVYLTSNITKFNVYECECV